MDIDSMTSQVLYKLELATNTYPSNYVDFVCVSYQIGIVDSSEFNLN